MSIREVGVFSYSWNSR